MNIHLEDALRRSRIATLCHDTAALRCAVDDAMAAACVDGLSVYHEYEGEHMVWLFNGLRPLEWNYRSGWRYMQRQFGGLDAVIASILTDRRMDAHKAALEWSECT